VVLYEMLTGELPLGRFAPPSQKAAVDPRLDEVVFRALETEPQRRYQRASEIKADVESVAGGRAPAAARAAGPRQGREPVLATALHQVRGPALGLLWAGVLAVLIGIGAGVVGIVVGLTGFGLGTPLGWLLLGLLHVVPGAILIAGGLKMRKC